MTNKYIIYNWFDQIEITRSEGLGCGIYQRVDEENLRQVGDIRVKGGGCSADSAVKKKWLDDLAAKVAQEFPIKEEDLVEIIVKNERKWDYLFDMLPVRYQLKSFFRLDKGEDDKYFRNALIKQSKDKTPGKNTGKGKAMKK